MSLHLEEDEGWLAGLITFLLCLVILAMVGLHCSGCGPADSPEPDGGGNIYTSGACVGHFLVGPDGTAKCVPWAHPAPDGGAL